MWICVRFNELMVCPVVPHPVEQFVLNIDKCMLMYIHLIEQHVKRRYFEIFTIPVKENLVAIRKIFNHSRNMAGNSKFLGFLFILLIIYSFLKIGNNSKDPFLLIF